MSMLDTVAAFAADVAVEPAFPRDSTSALSVIIGGILESNSLPPCGSLATWSDPSLWKNKGSVIANLNSS